MPVEDVEGVDDHFGVWAGRAARRVEGRMGERREMGRATAVMGELGGEGDYWVCRLIWLVWTS